MKQALWQLSAIGDRRFMKGLAAAALAGAVAWPATAQDREYQSENRSTYGQSRHQQDQPRYSQDEPRYSSDDDRYQQRAWDQQREQPSSQRSSRHSSDAIFRVNPNEWIRVGYDFDRDGRIDAVEDMRAADLQEAKSRSIEGRTARQGTESTRDSWQSSQRDTQRDPYSSMEDMQRRQAWDREAFDPYLGDTRSADMRREPVRESESEDTGQVLRRVAGTVSELRSQELAGQDKAHMLAKLDTARGLARVDLGPEPDLQKLNLKEGDEVAVVGTVGRINGRSVLMAHEIHAGKQTIEVERPRSAELRRFRGTIEDHRNVAFKDQDEEHVVARVRMNDGRLATVNLGAQNKLEAANLQVGDEVQFLARPGEINGETALIAEELWANNQNIDIQHADNRQQYEEARARVPQPGQTAQPQSSQPTPGSTQPQTRGQSIIGQQGSTEQPSAPPDREQTQPQLGQPSSPTPSSAPGEDQPGGTPSDEGSAAEDMEGATPEE